jgi:hypothetical protein
MSLQTTNAVAAPAPPLKSSERLPRPARSRRGPSAGKRIPPLAIPVKLDGWREQSFEVFLTQARKKPGAIADSGPALSRVGGIPPRLPGGRAERRTRLKLAGKLPTSR